VNESYAKKLRGLSSRSLRDAVIELCRPIADIGKVEIIEVGRISYFCIVEVSSVEQRLALTREMGGVSFASGVCFRILKL
jgi:hypothetical protein